MDHNIIFGISRDIFWVCEKVLAGIINVFHVVKCLCLLVCLFGDIKIVNEFKRPFIGGGFYYPDCNWFLFRQWFLKVVCIHYKLVITTLNNQLSRVKILLCDLAIKVTFLNKQFLSLVFLNALHFHNKLQLLSTKKYWKFIFLISSYLLIYSGDGANSWLATTWQGGHVGGQNKRIFPRRIYMKIEFSSQRREMLLFLTTNMAAVTSRANQQYGNYQVWRAIHSLASFFIALSSFYHKKAAIFLSECVQWWTDCVSLSMHRQVPCVSTVFNQEPRYVIEWVGNFYSSNAMINDIPLNVVFFPEPK